MLSDDLFDIVTIIQKKRLLDLYKDDWYLQQYLDSLISYLNFGVKYLDSISMEDQKKLEPVAPLTGVFNAFMSPDEENNTEHIPDISLPDTTSLSKEISLPPEFDSEGT